MKIAQINPGLLPIPPNGWGAVEKIIWEYAQVLRDSGHEVDIKYLNEIRPGEYDVVHVHMANLALELKEKGIPYFFSMHDHHAYWWGKDSGCFQNNLAAIEGSVLSFVHAQFLVGYFGSPKAIYLEHGVNIKEYSFVERDRKEKKLLCLANNGLINDQSHDRKGFRFAIEAARRLNLPITVAGPQNNKKFFDANPDLLQYGRLKILYDLDQKESVELFQDHDIFLHPSELEAGHPNLTLLEAGATGMPIVGCMESPMEGMILASRDSEDFASKIREAIDEYPILTRLSRENAEYHSWEVVCSKMLEHYEDSLGWKMGEKLIKTYETTPIKERTEKIPDQFIVKFGLKPDYIKVNTEIGIPGAGTVVLYKDRGGIIHYVDHGKESRRWSAYSHQGAWREWEIVFKNGSKVLKTFKMDLRGKLVGLSGDFDIVGLLSFVKEKGCVPIIIDRLSDEKKVLLREHGIAFSEKNVKLDYWFSWGTIKDWREKKKSDPPQKVLIHLRSRALGDTIAFVESCRDWREKHDIKPTVGINPAFIELFKGHDLDFIDQNSLNPSLYSDIILSDYHFDIELQHGFQQDLGLELKKRRPKIDFVPKERPIKGKYICFSTHSTAQCKYWNYPDGWEILCKMLRRVGITPVCIDRHESFGIEGHWNPVPKSSVKRLGMNFNDMMNHLHHAEIYVGLGSGHSWLAHSLGKETVMIVGPTSGEYEEDNYKIQNTNVCHGCFNKPRLHSFDPGDWMWCPINKGTESQHECTKTITPEEVYEEIMNLLC
jgi:autotransporter strand-loop-strand O-heptosyltransferase